MLYPLKFLPLYKNVLWGGNKLKGYGFDYEPLPNCGELWALSSVEGRESVIANGFLAENTLNEAIEIYMGDLVGDKVYNRFGTNFPLLFKVIDAAQAWWHRSRYRLSLEPLSSHTHLHARREDQLRWWQG